MKNFKYVQAEDGHLVKVEVPSEEEPKFATEHMAKHDNRTCSSVIEISPACLSAIDLLNGGKL